MSSSGFVHTTCPGIEIEYNGKREDGDKKEIKDKAGNKHMMIEAETKHVFTVSLKSLADPCWGSKSEISVTVKPTSAVSLYKENETSYSSGTPIPQSEFGMSKEFIIVAKGPSTDWDEIEITATWKPECKSTPSHSSCQSNKIYLTAYTISIQVQEKPWGGKWGNVKDKGTIEEEGTEIRRPRFHLWKENTNAIRAYVYPECLAKIVNSVEGSSFGFPNNPNALTTEDFGTTDPKTYGPDPSATPKWKRVTAGAGHGKGIVPTIIVPDSGSPGGKKEITGTQHKVYIMVNRIESVRWVGKDDPEYPSILKSFLKIEKAENENGKDDYRIFPEAESSGKAKPFDPDKPPSSSYDYEVGILVTISVAPQFADVEMHLKLLDPINRCVSGYGERVGKAENYEPKGTKKDNNGTAKFSAGETLITRTISANSTDHRIFASITVGSARPGDNYIVAAYPTEASETPGEFMELTHTEEVNGGSYNQFIYSSKEPEKRRYYSKISPILTTWRRLWYEKDYMATHEYLGMVPFIHNLIQNELERACIVVRDADDCTEIEGYIKNEEPTCIGMASVPWRESDTYDVSEDWKKFVRAFGSASIPASKPDFWTIYLVGAWHCDDKEIDGKKIKRIYGEQWGGKIMFYHGNAMQSLDDEGLDPYHEKIRESILLHEIGHALYLDDIDSKKRKNAAVKSVMLTNISFTERHEQDRGLYFNAKNIRKIQEQLNTRHKKTINDFRDEHGLNVVETTILQEEPMNQTLLTCALGTACICGSLAQATAQWQEPPTISVDEHLEMIVETDGMKDTEGVCSVYPGDAIYLILSLKNISNEEVGYIDPDLPRESDTQGIAKLHVPGEDLTYTFYRETDPNRHYVVYSLSSYGPPPVLHPGDVRQMLVERIELPPLEDQKSPFWTAILEKLETEPFVECELDVELEAWRYSVYCKKASIPIRIYRRAALMPGTETAKWNQGTQEMAMLDKWLEEVPEYFLPKMDDSPGAGRRITEESDLAMFPPGARPDGGDPKREEFSLLKTDYTRKPISPNTPTTVAGWKTLEEQFCPSTIRDEIQLRRMILEKSRATTDAAKQTKHREIVEWLKTLPNAQRTIMARDFGIDLKEDLGPAPIPVGQRPIRDEHACCGDDGLRNDTGVLGIPGGGRIALAGILPASVPRRGGGHCPVSCD